MTFLVCIAAIICLVWAAVFTTRSSIVFGGALFLLIGYVFGHPFWNVHLGPVPITLDRIVFVGLCVLFAWHWKTGRLELKPFSGTDYLLLLLVSLLTASTLLSPRAPGTPDGGSPMWRLIASYWMPLVLYFIAKHSKLDKKSMQRAMTLLGLLGIYLVFTAIAEVTHQWWAVFPRYIADPTLGTHFGRARGPTMMAASMGIFITFGALALWYRSKDLARPWLLAMIAFAPFCALSIYFTYTRSAWLGAAGALFVVLMLDLRGIWRRIALVSIVSLGLLVVVAKWDSILSLQRETSASDTLHSVEQRESFAYVSWEMFKDHPILGCGFGRFFDKKLPYLSDRRQQVELESIRELQHHNTFLGLLTETGMIGLALYLAVLIAMTRTAWQVANNHEAPAWVRSTGIFTLATMMNFMGSALFHDLSLTPTEHWMLFWFAGLTASLHASTVVSQNRNRTTSPPQEISKKTAAPTPWGVPAH